MYSMTGFSSLQQDYGVYQLSIEIRSVNHKNNDVKIHIDPLLKEKEKFCLDSLKECNYRGRVNASIRIEKSRQVKDSASFPEQELKKSIEDIKEIFADNVHFQQNFSMGDVLKILPYLQKKQLRRVFS